MTSLINLFHYILAAIGYYPIKFILLTIIFVLYIVTEKSYYYKNTNTDYKIYNFTINSLAVSLYIFIFIIVILVKK